MADFKSILTLNKEAEEKDLPFLDIIKTDLITLIDAANQAEIEYKVVYDMTTPLSGLGPLQQERIKLKIVKRLRDLSYKADFTTDFELTIQWTIATLSTSL